MELNFLRQVIRQAMLPQASADAAHFVAAEGDGDVEDVVAPYCVHRLETGATLMSLVHTAADGPWAVLLHRRIGSPKSLNSSTLSTGGKISFIDYA